MEQLALGHIGGVAYKIAENIARVASLADAKLIRCDYRPPVEFDLAFTADRELPLAAAAQVQTLDFVARAVVDGRFLNLTLNDKAANIAADERRYSGLVVVEHSSLVPVYPINLMTFRGSILGEWMRRALLHLNYSVETQCWVQESARQVSFVNAVLRATPRAPSRSVVGKTDHTIGRIFAESILKDSGVSRRKAREYASSMFPHGSAAVRPPIYGDWIASVISGWQGTLNLARVHVDSFVRDQEIRDHLPVDKILAQSKELAEQRDDAAVSLGTLGSDGNTNLSYLQWSVLYFCFLLRRAKAGVSIVSARQSYLQTLARDLACGVLGRDKADLTIIAFGDVYCDGNRDRIRDGRFTCVDDLNLYHNRDINCLTERFLHSRASSNLKLAFPLQRIGNTTRSRRHEPSSALVAAILMMDELPHVLQRAVTSGDFASVVQWANDAKDVQAKLRLTTSDIAVRLARAVQDLSPYP